MFLTSIIKFQTVDTPITHPASIWELHLRKICGLGKTAKSKLADIIDYFTGLFRHGFCSISPRASAIRKMEKEIENYSPQLVVCDDDPVVRELLLTAFESKRYDLKLFENGQQVIEACRNELPDLVVSDIKMPGLSGYEVCKWIKENSLPHFVPVVLLTSLNDVEDTVSGFNCGADEYITKPFAFPELHARVDALLRIKFLTDQLKQTQNLLAEKEKQLVAMSVAGGAAHELGQPLTSINLNCRLLRSIDPKSEDFQSILKEVEDQCGRMKQIIDKLSQLTNFSTRNYVGDIEIINLEDSD